MCVCMCVKLMVKNLQRANYNWGKQISNTKITVPHVSREWSRLSYYTKYRWTPFLRIRKIGSVRWRRICFFRTKRTLLLIQLDWKSTESREISDGSPSNTMTIILNRASFSRKTSDGHSIISIYFSTFATSSRKDLSKCLKVNAFSQRAMRWLF